MRHAQRPSFIFAGWSVELIRLENRSPRVCLSAALLLLQREDVLCWLPLHGRGDGCVHGFGQASGGVGLRASLAEFSSSIGRVLGGRPGEVDSLHACL